MAVQQGYGKMAGANSLVFAYDTGDAKNSFKGAPTTNLIPGVANPTLSADGWVEHGWSGSIDIDEQENALVLTATNGWHSIAYDFGTLNAPITVSFKAKLKSKQTTTIPLHVLNGLHLGDYDQWLGSIPTPTLTEYQEFVFTFTPTERALICLVLRGADTLGLTDEIYIKDLQVEQKSFKTAFVNGTRSNTEGLLDLTGNHAVDVSTVDFTEGFELDGTNDHMTFNLTKTPNMTFEFITNFSGNTTINQMIFNAGNSGAGPDLYMSCGKLNWNIWDGCGNSFGTIPGSWDNGKNHHVVLVNDQTNSITKLYYDGALLGTAIYRQCTAERMSIGGDAVSYNYQGNLPLFKVYSEALTEAQVQSNFKNYRKRFEGLDYHIDDATDGGGWIRWWWYTGVGWPGHETEALGHPFGTFDSSSHYGFQRLPEGLEKEQVELLAKDGDGNILKWDFASSSVIAQHVWDSFTQGTQGTWRQDGDPFNPEVIAGGKPNPDQDAWKYRVSEGVASFLLDDDGCDCQSTLNAGHAMCGGGWTQTYAQPDGAYLRYGVDTLNDGGCRGPVPERTLELYYRLK
jgi:hypothetical protein